VRRALVLVVGAWCWLGCPERAVPERGVQLVYRKPDGAPLVRATVDRRLARAKLKAHLQEDDHLLTVRLSEGADVGRIKQLLARRANLEFCPEDEPIASEWCRRAWPATVSVQRAERTCALTADARAPLDAALGDAGVALAFADDGKAVYAPDLGRCLAPRVTSAEPREGTLLLEFDKASGAEFAELTRRAVQARLLMRFEGTVRVAPVVIEPITGGRATLVVGNDPTRSEERRVGKECRRLCRSRWSPYH
jgi:preprotein translocase subunit SecD